MGGGLGVQVVGMGEVVDGWTVEQAQTNMLLQLT